MPVVERGFRAAGLAVMLAVAAGGRAGAQTWTVTLSGANEIPPKAVPGTGTAAMTLTGNLFHIVINFSGLTAGATGAHIHCCTPPGTNVGVATTLPAFLGFPLGVTSGTYDATLDVMDPSFYNPAFLAANGGTAAAARAVLFNGMNAGMAYLNIHTSQNPGGEIRGTLVLTPEPSTLLLFASGLGAAGGMLRWRRRDA